MGKIRVRLGRIGPPAAIDDVLRGCLEKVFVGGAEICGFDIRLSVRRYFPCNGARRECRQRRDAEGRVIRNFRRLVGIVSRYDARRGGCVVAIKRGGFDSRGEKNRADCCVGENVVVGPIYAKLDVCDGGVSAVDAIFVK